MQAQSLYHLLGIWQILIQDPSEVPGYWYYPETVCGRDYIRFLLDVCAIVRRKEKLLHPAKKLGHFADEGTLNRILESDTTLLEEMESTLSESQSLLRELQQQSAIKDASLNSEEPKKNLTTILNEGEEKKSDSLPELKNSVLDKLAYKSWLKLEGLRSKCCRHSCTRREVARYC